MSHPIETIAKPSFFDFEMRTPRPQAIEYLPSQYDDPKNLTFDYPRTLINALLHRQKVSYLEGIVLDDDIMHTYKDLYDTDGMQEGRIFEQSVAIVRELLNHREMDRTFKVESIASRHASRVAHEIEDHLKRRRGVIIGDATHAVLATGKLRGNKLLVIPPFPSSEEAVNQLSLSLTAVSKAVAKKDGYAWAIR